MHTGSIKASSPIFANPKPRAISDFCGSGHPVTNYFVEADDPETAVPRIVDDQQRTHRCRYVRAGAAIPGTSMPAATIDVSVGDATQLDYRAGHVWTAPAVQEESDLSAKRSGAAMYAACFRVKACLRRDAATVAAGPDVIR